MKFIGKYRSCYMLHSVEPRYKVRNKYKSKGYKIEKISRVTPQKSHKVC